MRLEQTIYECVEAGLYPAKLATVEEREGNWGNYALLTFELMDGNHDGVKVSGAASAKFGPKTKLYQWTKALLGGAAIARDYTLDTDALIGKPCLLDLDVETTSDGEFNRIVSVRPARSQAPRPQPQPWPDELDNGEPF